MRMSMEMRQEKLRASEWATGIAARLWCQPQHEQKVMDTEFAESIALALDAASINGMVEKAHDMACEKGWWETDRTPFEIAALIHSEVSEFVEEARNGRPALYTVAADGRINERTLDNWPIGSPNPEGLAAELADVVIRVADYCGRMGWDLQEVIDLKMAYNATRPHRHGGKLA